MLSCGFESRVECLCMDFVYGAAIRLRMKISSFFIEFTGDLAIKWRKIVALAFS